MLTTQPAGARLAAERYLAGKLPKELLLAVTEGVRRHTAKEPSLQPLLAKLLHGSLVIATDRANLERIKQLVATQGNPLRGRDLYLTHKGLACITCHKMEGVGGQIGPDLTRIWETQSLEKLVESIVQPSKEIKEGYQTYIAATTAGLTYTGLKVSESATEVVLKEATGRKVHVPKSELEELRATKTSLMPENAVALLTFEQFLDLLAFLKDRHAQESLRDKK